MLLFWYQDPDLHLLSTRFFHNVERDSFCDFQTLCWRLKILGWNFGLKLKFQFKSTDFIIHYYDAIFVFPRVDLKNGFVISDFRTPVCTSRLKPLCWMRLLGRFSNTVNTEQVYFIQIIIVFLSIITSKIFSAERQFNNKSQQWVKTQHRFSSLSNAILRST